MDQKIFEAIFNLAHQSKILDWLAVFFANYFGYLSLLGFVWILWREKNWQRSVYDFALVTLSVILSRGILTEIIRFFYFRARPFVALGLQPLFNQSPAEAAFPSGHAAFYFALAIAIFFINRKLGIWYIIAALVISLARVFSGVHWPSDIVGGALVGFVSAIVIKWTLSRSLK